MPLVESSANHLLYNKNWMRSDDTSEKKQVRVLTSCMLRMLQVIARCTGIWEWRGPPAARVLTKGFTNAECSVAGCTGDQIGWRYRKSRCFEWTPGKSSADALDLTLHKQWSRAESVTMQQNSARTRRSESERGTLRRNMCSYVRVSPASRATALASGRRVREWRSQDAIETFSSPTEHTTASTWIDGRWATVRACRCCASPERHSLHAATDEHAFERLRLT